MNRTHAAMLPDLDPDPFGERLPLMTRGPLQLLGGRFHFESNSRDLLRLVDCAYADLPKHRLSAAPAPRFKVRLLLSSTSPPSYRKRSEPAPMAMFCGAGLLGGAANSSNFVVLSPRQQSALVVLAPQMLDFPYHARYEFLEFAVFSLASHTQGLASLHAACVGRAGRGLLLMGPSGSGKSTVTMLCMLRGFDFVSEDSVFVAPDTMRATGVANFLHVRADSLRWLGRTREAAAIRKSRVIRRRSGVRKFEVDLRRGGFSLAPSPPTIAAIVFLSGQNAGDRAPLRLLSKSAARANLTASQAYAAGQPQWRAFLESASRIDCYELRRDSHPMRSVEQLRSLLPPG
jgi:hypothetical protein